MIVEKVKEIKVAEAKADAIIKGAEEKSTGIKLSLNEKIKKLRETKEKGLAEEVQKYRKIKDGKTSERLNILKEGYSKRMSDIKKEAEGKIIVAVESVWDELKNFLFRL
jgi:vacuolar-type H+-ATPase subunit H